MKSITGLFLGAGASYEAGMPLAWDLTAEIKNWLTPQKLRDFNLSWRAQGGGHTDAIVDDFISALERPELHYEAILGHLETQFRRNNNALRQEYHGLYSWLVEMVYHLLYFRQVNNRAFLDRQLPSYDGIKALADASEPLWVFSLNHDVMIETIAARLSIPLHTGFSSSTVTLPRRDASGQKNGEIRAEILTKNDLQNHAMHYPNPRRSGIYLMKIHGALDIFTFNDGRDILKLLPGESGQYGFIEVLRAANEGLFYPMRDTPLGRVKVTNEIAYADDQGEMQFLRRSLLAGAYKFDPRGNQVLPQSMLKHFRQNLNSVTNLICIGYAFGDVHINTVLREWLEFSSTRRLEIVNPSVDKIPAFLLHLFSQVTVTNSDTTDFFDQRAGIVRTRREKLENRVVNMLRRLGQPRADQVFAAFAGENQERAAKVMISKLHQLPLVDGRPDFAQIGDPAEAAKRWAAEAKLSEEELLVELLKHLGDGEQK